MEDATDSIGGLWGMLLRHHHLPAETDQNAGNVSTPEMTS